MTERNDIAAIDTLMNVLGWTRATCDTCGSGVFTRTDDGDVVCRMCGEPHVKVPNPPPLELQQTADS